MPDVPLAGLEALHVNRVRTHRHKTTMKRRRLTVTEHEDLVFSLAGELDIESAAYLGARLAAHGSAGDIVVRTADLQFVDLTGCRLLIEVAERLDDGSRMVLPDPRANLLQILSICGWQDHPRLVLAPDGDH